jgi:ABC-2 type transport system permease protein
MRKYMEVFRISFKMQITWRFDVVMTMVAIAGRIAAAWILWLTIFQGRAIVSGFTFEAIMSYYIVSAIISSIDFSYQIGGEVSWLIRDGGFSKHMITPMNPMGFFGSMVGGESTFHLVFSLFAAAACFLAFGLNIILSTDAASVLLAVVMILMGLAFMTGYHYFVGVMTFKFLSIDFFTHVQSSIIAFATGSMIPISLLPNSVASVLRYLPFTHVVYTPAMLLTGQKGVMEGVIGLCVLSGWTAAILIIAQKTYTKMRIKYDGVGI